MSNMKVVMMTFSGDLTSKIADLRRRLEDRGAEVLRFDTDRFPTEAQVLFCQDAGRESLRLRCDGQEIELGPGDAIWYRRSRWASQLPRSLDPQLRHGCLLESEALLRGVMAAAPCFVMDPPELVRARGHKPYQQRLARELGLATPRTLMTNDPVAAREFVLSCPNGAIAKMLVGFAVLDDEGQEQVVFTTSLDEAHLERLDGLKFAPMVFQEKIRKQVELRVTVIGSRMFTAAVDSQRMAGAEVDWRERGVALLGAWTPYVLPPEVERALGRYMERIGMQYSAIDLLVEPDGRHVFLEANPAGECFWLEHYAPHFPLTEALADVLLGVPGARRTVCT
jgi:glutathione synthase/RimK-type ligase-like ATP-grasp enzyme